MQKLIALMLLLSSAYNFGAAEPTTKTLNARDLRQRKHLTVDVSTRSDTDEDDFPLPGLEAVAANRTKTPPSKPPVARPPLRVAKQQPLLEDSPAIHARRQQFAMDMLFASLKG